MSTDDFVIDNPFIFLNAVMNWSVYIILCTDKSLYTGISTNVSRRFAQHASLKGAKYFRGRQPSEVIYVENGHNRSSAGKREIAIKKLNRQEKFQLIASGLNMLDANGLSSMQR
ncbi:MAG: GIY-YIG nuclease family protein [Methylovulum sp.]|nr:GIY-YIG nuclease family protein [Methylovulum sp.]